MNCQPFEFWRFVVQMQDYKGPNSVWGRGPSPLRDFQSNKQEPQPFPRSSRATSLLLILLSKNKAELDMLWSVSRAELTTRNSPCRVNSRDFTTTPIVNINLQPNIVWKKVPKCQWMHMTSSESGYSGNGFVGTWWGGARAPQGHRKSEADLGKGTWFHVTVFDPASFPGP